MVLARFPALLLLSVLLWGCASQPGGRVVAVSAPSGSLGSVNDRATQVVRVPAMPAVAQQYLAEARQAIEETRYDRAQVLLGKSQRLSPGHPEIYLAWGRLHSERGDWHRAEQMYRRAQSLSPSGSQFYREAQERLSRLP